MGGPAGVKVETGSSRQWLRAALWLVGIAGLLLVGAAVFAPYLAAMNWWRQAGTPGVSPDRPELAYGLAWADDWFAVGQLSPGVFAIAEPRYGQCNFSWLVVGSRRALLFDAGPGLRDISKIVKGLTDLPVTALPSHLHFDHVGGISAFADLALPDLPALRARETAAGLPLGRFQHLGFVEGFAAPTLRVTRWIKPGQAIDLGGRTVSFSATPGHTDSSIVLADHRTGDFFTGDTLYPGHVYAFLPGTDLSAYRRSIRTLLKRLPEGGRLHGGHGCAGPGPVALPSQGRPELAALDRALGTASRAVPDPVMPRRIEAGHGVILLAKHAWMAK